MGSSTLSTPNASLATTVSSTGNTCLYAVTDTSGSSPSSAIAEFTVNLTTGVLTPVSGSPHAIFSSHNSDFDAGIVAVGQHVYAMLSQNVDQTHSQVANLQVNSNCSLTQRNVLTIATSPFFELYGIAAGVINTGTLTGDFIAISDAGNGNLYLIQNDAERLKLVGTLSDPYQPLDMAFNCAAQTFFTFDGNGDRDAHLRIRETHVTLDTWGSSSVHSYTETQPGDCCGVLLASRSGNALYATWWPPQSDVYLIRLGESAGVLDGTQQIVPFTVINNTAIIATQMTEDSQEHFAIAGGTVGIIGGGFSPAATSVFNQSSNSFAQVIGSPFRGNSVEEVGTVAVPASVCQ
jgi:hypothetical protein